MPLGRDLCYLRPGITSSRLISSPLHTQLLLLCINNSLLFFLLRWHMVVQKKHISSSRVAWRAWSTTILANCLHFPHHAMAWQGLALCIAQLEPIFFLLSIFATCLAKLGHPSWRVWHASHCSGTPSVAAAGESPPHLNQPFLLLCCHISLDLNLNKWFCLFNLSPGQFSFSSFREQHMPLQ
jgi:hypothetical protein